MGFLNGQMVESISECGKKVNSMDLEYSPIQKVNKGKENGVMVKELDG